MFRPAILTTLIGAALTCPPVAASAQPRTPPSAPPRCFSARDWQSWRAADDHVMYVRARGHDLYRIEFDGGCPNLSWPDVHLVSIFRGSDEVCAPIDLDLKVSDGHGMSIACIVSKITPVPYADAAAMPKKLLP